MYNIYFFLIFPHWSFLPAHFKTPFMATWFLFFSITSSKLGCSCCWGALRRDGNRLLARVFASHRPDICFYIITYWLIVQLITLSADVLCRCEPITGQDVCKLKSSCFPLHSVLWSHLLLSVSKSCCLLHRSWQDLDNILFPSQRDFLTWMILCPNLQVLLSCQIFTWVLPTASPPTQRSSLRSTFSQFQLWRLTGWRSFTATPRSRPKHGSGPPTWTFDIKLFVIVCLI